VAFRAKLRRERERERERERDRVGKKMEQKSSSSKLMDREAKFAPEFCRLSKGLQTKTYTVFDIIKLNIT
jgi:hypothetical protein